MQYPGYDGKTSDMNLSVAVNDVIQPTTNNGDMCKWGDTNGLLKTLSTSKIDERWIVPIAMASVMEKICGAKERHLQQQEDPETGVSV